MSTKKRKGNEISLAYRIDAAPKSMTKAQVFRAMIDGVRSGDGSLPKGLKVTWKWRNNPRQRLREGDFQRVIRDSGGKGSKVAHAGFLTLMEKRLTRDAFKYAPGFDAPAPPRKATKKEIAAIERKQEEAEERRNKKGQGTRAKELKAKRSEAAKRGWETRRRKVAAQKRKDKRETRGRTRKI